MEIGAKRKGNDEDESLSLGLANGMFGVVWGARIRALHWGEGRGFSSSVALFKF